MDEFELFHIDPIYWDISNFPSPPPPPAQFLPSPLDPALDQDGNGHNNENVAGEGSVELHPQNNVSVGGGDSRGAVVRRKAITDEDLAELAETNPKRAKRILANRQSAAKSKENKMRYVFELEERVEALMVEENTRITRLATYERDRADLTTQNEKLKMQVEAKERIEQLREEQNKKLEEEVEYLKEKTAATGNLLFGSPLSQSSPPLLPQQFPNPPYQHQAPQQSQLYMHLPLPQHPYGQLFSGQWDPSFSNFN